MSLNIISNPLHNKYLHFNNYLCIAISLFISALSMPSQAVAQSTLTICNKRTSEIRAAVAVSTVATTLSWGWTHISPGQCRQAGRIGGSGYICLRIEEKAANDNALYGPALVPTGAHDRVSYCAIEGDRFDLKAQYARECGKFLLGGLTTAEKFHEINFTDPDTPYLVDGSFIHKRDQESDPTIRISAKYSIRAQGYPNTRPSGYFKIARQGGNIKVNSDEYNGFGKINGRKGFFDWQFTDGRTGRSEFWIDKLGNIHGLSKGSGIWFYWTATRE